MLGLSLCPRCRLSQGMSVLCQAWLRVRNFAVELPMLRSPCYMYQWINPFMRRKAKAWPRVAVSSQSERCVSRRRPHIGGRRSFRGVLFQLKLLWVENLVPAKGVPLTRSSSQHVLTNVPLVPFSTFSSLDCLLVKVRACSPTSPRSLRFQKTRVLWSMGLPLGWFCPLVNRGKPRCAMARGGYTIVALLFFFVVVGLHDHGPAETKGGLFVGCYSN